MDVQTFPGDIFPDFLTALISELETVKCSVGCISVGEFDKEQWYQLPLQISNVVDRLSWCRKQNDCAALAQHFHHNQSAAALLHIKSKALQAWIVREHGRGWFCSVDHAFDETRLKPWADLLVLIDDLLNDVHRLFDELEQHRQSAKAHLAAMRQTLEEG